MNPILVFDLDETLIYSKKSYKEGKYSIESIKLIKSKNNI